jgi:DNA-binding CsgD family transcriptional regulator
MDIEDDLRRWARDRLVELDISQKELAVALGVSQGTVSARIGEHVTTRSQMSPAGWDKLVRALDGTLVCYASSDEEDTIVVPADKVERVRTLARLDGDHLDAVVAYAELWGTLTPRERTAARVVKTLLSSLLPTL